MGCVYGWPSPVKTPRQSLGNWGEGVAAAYLETHGYSVLDRNARTPYGEIDIVARQQLRDSGKLPSIPESIVFVEVKTRSTRAFGPPEQSVTARKQAHMLSAAQFYLQEHPELDGDWRIDVIAVARYRPDRRVEIQHFENVIQ